MVGGVISSQAEMQKAVVLAMLLCIPISSFLYHTIELPFIKVGRVVVGYRRGNNLVKNLGLCKK